MTLAFRRLLGIAALVTLVGPALSAQSTTATIQGTVQGTTRTPSCPALRSRSATCRPTRRARSSTKVGQLPLSQRADRQLRGGRWSSLGSRSPGRSGITVSLNQDAVVDVLDPAGPRR